MRNLVILLIVGLSLTACNKVKHTLKYLDGNWNLYEYQYTNPLGLTYFYESTGGWSFTNIGEKTCDYSLNIHYIKDGTGYDKIESGQMELTDEDSFLLHRDNGNGTTTTLTYGTIYLITKDDLKLEFGDEYGLHEFILQK